MLVRNQKVERSYADFNCLAFPNTSASSELYFAAKVVAEFSQNDSNTAESSLQVPIAELPDVAALRLRRTGSQHSSFGVVVAGKHKLTAAVRCCSTACDAVVLAPCWPLGESPCFPMERLTPGTAAAEILTNSPRRSSPRQATIFDKMITDLARCSLIVFELISNCNVCNFTWRRFFRSNLKL